MQTVTEGWGALVSRVDAYVACVGVTDDMGPCAFGLQLPKAMIALLGFADRNLLSSLNTIQDIARILQLLPN